MLGSRKSQRTIRGEEMKKKTLLNAIMVLLLIIMGVSFIVSAFMQGKDSGFAAIGFMSLFYLSIITIIVMKHD